jgi:hypothetical protein
MKKIILIAAIAVCSISSYAQVSFGAQVGANLGMGHADYGGGIYGTAANLAVTNDPKVGFLIGVLGEIEFGKIAFRPELNFIQKGSKNGGYYDYYYSSTTTKKTTLNYVEVPLNVVYNLKVGSAGKAFFGLGPAVGIGLGGTDKYNDEDINGNLFTKHKVKFDGKNANETASGDIDTHYKRVDIGLNILAGFQLEMGAFAKIGYTHGFSNIDPNKDVTNVNSTYKNRGITICIGYMLGGKKGK